MNTESNLDLHTGNCIRTYTGLYMNVFDPKPEMICIEDIAHALSHMPRFGGHTPQFYSVAQHSIWCATMVEEGYELEALLHDATEAYLMDMPKPIKRGLSNYDELESKLMAVIAEKFNLRYPFDPCIKEVDKWALEHEYESINKGLMESNTHTANKELFLEYFKFYSRTMKISK